MITTKEQLMKADSAVKLDIEFARKITKSVRLTKLHEKFQLMDRKFVVISKGLLETIQERLKNIDKKMKKLKGGGRPRIPDPTPEEIAKMTPKELNTYRMRIWKRQSRERLKK